ncbi:hypothetical protein J4061_004470 [Salmonella enterica]|nr:hypothetical protein [Salmonella enterica]
MKNKGEYDFYHKKVMASIQRRNVLRGVHIEPHDRKLLEDSEEAQKKLKQKETVTQILCAHALQLPPEAIAKIYGNSLDFVNIVIKDWEDNHNQRKNITAKLDAKLEAEIEAKKVELRHMYEDGGFNEREMQKKFGVTCRQLYQWLDLNRNFVVNGDDWRPRKKRDIQREESEMKAEKMAEFIADGCSVVEAARRVGFSVTNASNRAKQYNVYERAAQIKRDREFKPVPITITAATIKKGA